MADDGHRFTRLWHTDQRARQQPGSEVGTAHAPSSALKARSPFAQSGPKGRWQRPPAQLRVAHSSLRAPPSRSPFGASRGHRRRGRRALAGLYGPATRLRVVLTPSLPRGVYAARRGAAPRERMDEGTGGFGRGLAPLLGLVGRSQRPSRTILETSRRPGVPLEQRSPSGRPIFSNLLELLDEAADHQTSKSSKNQDGRVRFGDDCRRQTQEQAEEQAHCRRGGRDSAGAEPSWRFSLTRPSSGPSPMEGRCLVSRRR